MLTDQRRLRRIIVRRVDGLWRWIAVDLDRRDLASGCLGALPGLGVNQVRNRTVSELGLGAEWKRHVHVYRGRRG